MTITDVDDDVVDDTPPDDAIVVEADGSSSHDRDVRRLRQVSLFVVGLTSLYLGWMVRDGRVGVGYQGDEGIRIFDAYQSAFQYPNALHGGIADTTSAEFFGVHPPGDNLLRSSVAWGLDLVDWTAGPVVTMFLLSIIAVGVAHLLAVELARRAAGLTAGYLTLFLLLGSYVFSDIKVSSMGEAIAAPLLMASLLLLQRSLDRNVVASYRLVGGAGALFALSTFVRPEVPLLLPGMCLVLWWLIGFHRAALFGVVAASFELAKLVNSVFFASDDQLSLLNVGSAYENGQRSLVEVWRSDFGQQLIREPGLLVFLLGVFASLAYLIATAGRATIAWRTHALVVGAVASYLAINVFSQLLGLSPHAAYRIVTAIAPLMVVAFAIAFVAMTARLGPQLRSSFGELRAASIQFAFVAVLCAWGAYTFATDRVDELADRVPDGVRASADEVIARSEPGDAIFVDHLRYWNNAMLGYFADRDAAICNYSRCSVSDDAAEEVWASVRADEVVPSTRSWGEFTALRAHVFISEEQPSHLVIASGEIHEDWNRVASGAWGEDAELWRSHVFPYLAEEVDFERPQENFVRLGTIDGVEYFDEWVFLIPRNRNDIGIVYEAFYGRTPEAG